jgi:hypothetical protein
MIDDLSVKSSFFDSDFESIERNILKEIDSFDEKKPIDFNFKLKVPVSVCLVDFNHIEGTLVNFFFSFFFL